jgi:hypothetical protein
MAITPIPIPKRYSQDNEYRRRAIILGTPNQWMLFLTNNVSSILFFNHLYKYQVNQIVDDN